MGSATLTLGLDLGGFISRGVPIYIIHEPFPGAGTSITVVPDRAMGARKWPKLWLVARKVRQLYYDVLASSCHESVRFCFIEPRSALVGRVLF